MPLNFSTLGKRLEAMPIDEEHLMVWHLCYADRHLKMCSSAELGRLALVTEDAPILSDSQMYNDGIFLMRLHPLKNHLQEDSNGDLQIYLPAATSYPHSTVWSFQKKRIINN